MLLLFVKDSLILTSFANSAASLWMGFHRQLASTAASRTLAVPMTLVLTASIVKNPQVGACLSAAAWKMGFVKESEMPVRRMG